MTDDLVRRLRIAADRADTVFDPDFASPWREAAACIEQQKKRNKELEAALRKIEEKYWYPSTAEIARAALGGKKDG
jgi:hypothetical protein